MDMPHSPGLPAARRALTLRLPRALYYWGVALLLPAFLVGTALTQPVAEHAGDAALFHIYRGVIFSTVRAEGVLYPRWAPALNAGLGGPLFSFYPPLIYYLLDALHALGLPHPLGWRVLVALAGLAASTGMFALALHLWRRPWVALACAAAFAYAPCLLQDLLERGSPQGWALALGPWLFCLLLRAAERPAGRRLAAAGLCWAATILLHTLTALILAPLAALLLGVAGCRYGRRALAAGVGALALGALLAAFYVVPFLAGRRDVKLGNASQVGYTQPAAHPLPAAELLAGPRVLDTGLGNNSLGRGVGLLYGLPPALAPLAAGLLWRRGRRGEAALVGGLLLIAGVALWLQTDPATLVWRALPALSLLQFRWRLLGPVALAAVLTFGYLLSLAPQRRQGWLAGLLALVYVGAQLPSLYPQLLPQWAVFPHAPTVTDAQAFARSRGVYSFTAFDELLPRWRTMALTEQEAQEAAGSPLANLPAGARIGAVERRAGELRVQLDSPEPFTAQVRILYFPGWVGTVDGRRQPLQPQENSGYIQIAVPAGAHILELRYEGTPFERLGAGLSLLALAALVLLALLWRGRPAAGEPISYPAPRYWLPALLLLAAGLKLQWVDPQTTLLRAASTCGDIAGAQAADVRFGTGPRLCGYELPRKAYHPGDMLHITLYWQAPPTTCTPAHSFVHLLGATANPETGNPLWGQQDKDAPGGYPVCLWTAGSLYRDEYRFRIPAHTPPGEYQLEIGWWDPAQGVRLRPQITGAPEGLAVSELDALLIEGIRVQRR